MEKLVELIKKSKRVYICGNGGSAANSLHFANDLVSVGVNANSLVANISTLTAIANDFGYEYVFSRQIQTFGDSGDLLIVLSGSGNSLNVLNAILVAKNIGMKTFGIVGGGKCLSMLEHYIQTDPNMQLSEQTQLEICHQVMKSLS